MKMVDFRSISRSCISETVKDERGMLAVVDCTQIVWLCSMEPRSSMTLLVKARSRSFGLESTNYRPGYCICRMPNHSRTIGSSVYRTPMTWDDSVHSMEHSFFYRIFIDVVHPSIFYVTVECDCEFLRISKSCLEWQTKLTDKGVKRRW